MKTSLWKCQAHLGQKKTTLNRKFLYGIIKFQEERDALIEQQRGIPKLIINGRYDSSCEYQSALDFAKHFDDAKVVLYDTEHNGYDKKTKKYSFENTKMINKEMIKFIKSVTALRDYLKK